MAHVVPSGIFHSLLDRGEGRFSLRGEDEAEIEGGGEDALFGALDPFPDVESDEEEALLDPVPPGKLDSRVAQSSRIRQALLDGDQAAAYARGALDALRALAPEEETSETFGSIWTLAGSVLSPFVEGALGTDVKTTKAQMQDLGRKVGETLGTRKPRRPKRPGSAPSAEPPRTAEAESSALPPVYVADPAAPIAAAPVDLGPTSAMPPVEQFGAAASYGWVSHLRRDRQRAAVRRALDEAQVKQAAVVPEAPVVFQEDLEAKPLLYSDGEIWDAVYGALVATPCPSCGGLHEDAARQGLAADCGVCSGYGALLVPETDLPSWVGAEDLYAFGAMDLEVEEWEDGAHAQGRSLVPASVGRGERQ